MAKEPVLGKKYTCFKCACKFYDLGRPEPVCPRCNTNQKSARHDELKAAAARSIRRPVEIEEEDLDVLPPPGDEIGYEEEADLAEGEFLEEDLGGATIEDLEGPLPEEEEVYDDEE